MPAVDPRVVIRLGSHAEKEYLEKTLKYFDGFMLGANLIEATPGASASLLVRFGGGKQSIPYYIDPMTYAFGSYVDRDSGKLRNDLDWIKSEQKIGKKVERAIKRSYSKLAPRLGGLVTNAVRESKAIVPENLIGEARAEFCKATVNYQLTRLKEEFENDEALKNYADEVPRPTVVFAPYFYIEPSQEEKWFAANMDLARDAVAGSGSVPIHAILCVDASALLRPEFRTAVLNQLPDTGVKGVWLWFSRFSEEKASLGELRALRELTEGLANKIEVFNLHGGFFSLTLCKYGMQGISHGMGYGEQKDVIPVIGQSTPTVRYYVPPLKIRLGVPDVEVCFDGLGINEAKNFHKMICDCVVCKGVIADDLRNFGAFGEMHLSRPVAKRHAQTPAAAKRCRFHFLLNRIKERNQLKSAQIEEIVAEMQAAHATWRYFQAIEKGVDHLERWASVLK